MSTAEVAEPTPCGTPPTRQEMTAAELDREGLLRVDRHVVISRYAIFLPFDELGTPRPVTIQAGAVIGPFAVVHGGARIGEQARIEEHSVVGKPELGYAVGKLAQAPVATR